MKTWFCFMFRLLDFPKKVSMFCIVSCNLERVSWSCSCIVWLNSWECMICCNCCSSISYIFKMVWLICSEILLSKLDITVWRELASASVLKCNSLATMFCRLSFRDWKLFLSCSFEDLISWTNAREVVGCVFFSILSSTWNNCLSVISSSCFSSFLIP